MLTLHNAVPQALSSIFTDDLREAETFLLARASIAASPLPTSALFGAEIGGPSAARGDRRRTGVRILRLEGQCAGPKNTINYGRTLPLAQGVQL